MSLQSSEENHMKLLTVVGARPQFIKAAAISRAVSKQDKITEVVVHTGQHFDRSMSDIFFEEMGIPDPKYNLCLNQMTHGAMTGRMIEKIEEVIFLEKPDCLLVYGDTNSTLAGALAAVKQNVKIAHVEAGLRSFNMKMPEEVNRVLTDRVSSVLFCPSEQAVMNLKNEGFDTFHADVLNVGDVMYDVAMHYANISKNKCKIKIPERDYALVTIHRAENTDDPERLRSIIEALNELSTELEIVLPLHPRTKKIIEELKLDFHFKVIPPVGYFEMLELLKGSKIVLTDSGGLQKEAYFFNKHCITMRDETEWMELVILGFNRLVGADKRKIILGCQEFLSKETIQHKGLYGDSHAGDRIIDYLANHF